MRRHPALIPFSHDHHHGLAVARRLRRAASADDRAAAAEAFTRFVQGEGGEHFREEEELLFPLVCAALDGPSELVERAVLDHAALRGAAVRLGQGAPDADALHALGERLEAHIRLEERELFPLAERVVPEPALQAMALAVRVPPGGRAEGSALDAAGDGALWSAASADLNVTVLAWPPGGGVTEHTNAERDVLLVVVAGGGALVVDGRRLDLRAPQAVLVPKGTARAITAGPEGLRYVSAHLRRSGLVPLRPR